MYSIILKMYESKICLPFLGQYIYLWFWCRDALKYMLLFNLCLFVRMWIKNTCRVRTKAKTRTSVKLLSFVKLLIVFDTFSSSMLWIFVYFNSALVIFIVRFELYVYSTETGKITACCLWTLTHHYCNRCVWSEVVLHCCYIHITSPDYGRLRRSLALFVIIKFLITWSFTILLLMTSGL